MSKLQIKVKKLALFILLLFLLWPFALTKAAPQDIAINEIMYNPSQCSDYDCEWIELYNRGVDQVDLSGWTLDGAAFGNPIINKGEYIIVARELIDGSDTDTKSFEAFWGNNSGVWGDAPNENYHAYNGSMSLTNTGDSIILKSATDYSETITYQSNWGANGNGRSLERQSDGTFAQSSIENGTPGAENSPPPPPEPPAPLSPAPSPQSNQSTPLSEVSLSQTEPEGESLVALTSIKEARQKAKGVEVLIEGIITAPPGNFSSRYFYLQDSTAGIQIYFSKTFPNLALGQKVRVLGVLSESYNEKRIKISQSADVSVLGQAVEPAPVVLKTSQITEDYEGILIKIKGKVNEPSGSTFELDDGSGKIKIYLKKEVKIEKPRLKTDDELEISGIVSQYKDAYRILPRSENDLKTAAGQPLANLTEERNSDENGEEETVDEESAANKEKNEGKVLGATTKANQNLWWLWLILAGLAIGGYVGYDYQNFKRGGDSKIWSKVSPLFARWRNYWTNRRAGKR